MNAAGRRHRDAEIASKHARGFSLVTLGRLYGLSERQLRRILDAQRKQNGSIFDGDAHAQLEHLIEQGGAGFLTGARGAPLRPLRKAVETDPGRSAKAEWIVF